MSREALAAFPEKTALGDKYADAGLCGEITRAAKAETDAWEEELAAGDIGLAEAWQKPETDISQWAGINLPGDFAGTLPDNFCGVIWLCKEFEVGPEFAGKESKLWMGTIVDADTAYINGVEAGNTSYRYPPRKYIIPAGLLREGKNRIVVRVVSCNGEGGFTRGKAFRLFCESGTLELGGTWKYKLGFKAAAPRPQEFFFQRQPMGLFNAMIAPILGYPCQGVLWYQGESNDGSPREYPALFTALINDWRIKHSLSGSQRVLPFLFVQLPVYGEPEENNESSSWALIREAQCFALSLPFTGMAAGLDLGEWNDLHPINKKGIGLRLALAARKTIFNEQNTAPGPMLRRVERREGKLFLTFTNCGEGLVCREKPYLSIASGDIGRTAEEFGGTLFRLSAETESPECLSVDIHAVDKPTAVLYAWANNPRDRQLYNSDGLPAIPFRAEIPREES
jgi:sialate O-acetylesterase